MIEIDGSRGEGGGQVLRTSLSVAALTGQAIKITRIRAGRSNPGLAPQHLTAVRALASLCGAEIRGDELRSTEVEFRPGGAPRPGEYSFDVADAAPNGSAGSVTLLAQALIPVLLFAEGSSAVELAGGTHVRWSPSFEYFDQVYLPQLTALGFRVEAELETPGFYPVGGGRVVVHIRSELDREMRPINLNQRGDLVEIGGAAIACNLPAHIPQRMTDRSRGLLADLGASFAVEPRRLTGAGPGAVITLLARYGDAVSGFTAHGERGVPSEEVAEEACAALLEHHASGAPVDQHLADQLLLPLALVKGRSRFTAQRGTGHLRTSAELLAQLLSVKVELDNREEDGVMVELESPGFKR